MISKKEINKLRETNNKLRELNNILLDDKKEMELKISELRDCCQIT